MNGTYFRKKEMDRLSKTYAGDDQSKIPEWEMKAYHDIQKVMDAMKIIIDYGNVMGHKGTDTAEILVDALEDSHRTLQQSAISALIQTLIFYAEARNDGRNEYSVRVCKAITQFLEEKNFTYNGSYSARLI